MAICSSNCLQQKDAALCGATRHSKQHRSSAVYELLQGGLRAQRVHESLQQRQWPSRPAQQNCDRTAHFTQEMKDRPWWQCDAVPVVLTESAYSKCQGPWNLCQLTTRHWLQECLCTDQGNVPQTKKETWMPPHSCSASCAPGWPSVSACRAAAACSATSRSGDLTNAAIKSEAALHRTSRSCMTGKLAEGNVCHTLKDSAT